MSRRRLIAVVAHRLGRVLDPRGIACARSGRVALHEVAVLDGTLSVQVVLHLRERLPRVGADEVDGVSGRRLDRAPDLL